MCLLACSIVCLTLPVSASRAAAEEIAVRGRVAAQNGKPVAGTVVKLDGVAVHASARTASDGSFIFTRPPVTAGDYTLSVTAAGFARLTRRHIAVADVPLDLGTLTLVPSLTPLKVIGSAVARERLPFNSTPVALKVFPREAYRDQGQAALSAVLNQTPGVNAVRSAGVNAAQPQAPYTASIRGGLPFETAVLVDGNPIALPGSGTFDLAFVPSFVLQEVEVLKGYGSAESTIPGAIDGVLNLRTADPGTLRKALLEVEADTRGGQFSDLAYGGAAGRLSFSTMFSVDGNPGPNTGFAVAGEALQRAQLLKAKYQLSPAMDVTASYLGSQNVLGLAAARGLRMPGGFASFAASPDAVESDRFGLYSLEVNGDNGSDHLSGRIYGMQVRRTGAYEPVAFPGFASGMNSLDSIAGFSLQDDHQIAGNLYQLELSHRNGFAEADEFIAPGARNDQTVLRGAAILHPSAALDLQFAVAALGMRERYSDDGGATFHDATVWTPVFHAGAALHVRPNVTVRLATGSGAAAPPAAALNVDPARVFLEHPLGLPPYALTRSSSSLSAETSFGFDAGVEYRLHGDTTTLSADAYHVVTHGAYVDGSSSAPAVEYRWFNGPPMTHEGVEFSLQQFKRVGLGFIAQASFARTYVNSVPAGFYNGYSNLAVIPGQNLSGGSPLVLGANDVAQTRVPYAQAYGEISYKWPRGSRLSLGALYYGANNPFYEPAFAELNANLELSVGALSKFQISMENLTNAFGGALPSAYAGVPIRLAGGSYAATNAGVLPPRTIRIMFRQSIGPGTLFER